MNARIVFSLMGAVVLCSVVRAAEHTKDTLDDVKQNLSAKKAVLIDVREPAEWKLGHLRDAQLVPLSDLKKMGDDDELRRKLEAKLPKDRIIYCHCASGFRVKTAGDILGKLGYDIRPLAPGFKALQQAGFPVAEQAKSGQP